MRHLAFGIALLAVGTAAATPARADFTVIRFSSGYCQIWGDSTATPWGAGWTKIAIAPDWPTATAAFQAARQAGTCANW
jgi:hypothetical protein